jgi:hypothetical protein
LRPTCAGHWTGIFCTDGSKSGKNARRYLDTFAVEKATKVKETLDVLRGPRAIADSLGLSYWLTHRLIRSGELPGRYIGGSDVRSFTTSRRALAEYFANVGLPK